jgi:pyruvate kinase
MAFRLTKIIATLGPASGSKTMIWSLMAEGGGHHRNFSRHFQVD